MYKYYRERGISRKPEVILQLKAVFSLKSEIICPVYVTTQMCLNMKYTCEMSNYAEWGLSYVKCSMEGNL